MICDFSLRLFNQSENESLNKKGWLIWQIAAKVIGIFPTLLLENFIRRLISPPEEKIRKYVSSGTTVADVGCGPGHFTISIAEAVGPKGRVYAADSDPKSIKVLKAKSNEKGFQATIDARTASAANLQFVPDRSVDFAFANGVLCCMEDHAGAVGEIKRILKPDGLAYISVTKLFGRLDPKAVTKQEWKRILEGFNVQEMGEGLLSSGAAVSIK